VPRKKRPFTEGEILEIKHLVTQSFFGNGDMRTADKAASLFKINPKQYGEIYEVERKRLQEEYKRSFEL